MDVVGQGAAILTNPVAAQGTARPDGVDGIPPLFARLCDDAALFPPGNAAAHDAVPAHRQHRAAWYRQLVGPFLATARHVPAVAEAARADAGSGPLALVLVVPEGPSALAAALQATEREPGTELIGVELACAPEIPLARGSSAHGSSTHSSSTRSSSTRGSSTQGSSADAAREAAWMLERELPPGVGGAVEVRRGDGLADALDVLAAGPYRAKLRTGGTTAAAFPTEAELAAFIVGCVTRGLPFKCTAGLHEAVRHTDPTTGFEHHGFLNILAATSAATQGADEAAVATVLGVRSGLDLVATLRALTPDAITRTRRAFTAYGTCSIAEPLADLIELGAL